MFNLVQGPQSQQSPKNSPTVRSIYSITPYFKHINSNNIHLVAITLPHNVWVMGHPFLESRGEEISPNHPSASSSLESSTIILLHIEEPIESHITSDHSRDDPLNHPSILPRQPSPLDIFVYHPPCFLGDHQFIIYEATLWYRDTMYANP